MGAVTGILWTDRTFNPWIGCTKKHTGCKNCYAETLATTRLGRRWGPGAERRLTVDSNWKQPIRWAKAAAKAGRRDRVFCASLADVLDEEAPPEGQARLWDLIRSTAIMPTDNGGGLDWQLLTKRPERWELIPADVRPLVWLGTSISDQETADEWIPRLMKAEGFRYRFLSVEPLVGPVNLRIPKTWGRNSTGDWGCDACCNGDRCDEPMHVARRSCSACGGSGRVDRPDWVIVGGESGHGARTCDTAWIRRLVDQCEAAKVPCFVKQLGAKPVGKDFGPPGPGHSIDALITWQGNLAHSHGGDIDEFPVDLRVRQFPAEAR